MIFKENLQFLAFRIQRKNTGTVQGKLKLPREEKEEKLTVSAHRYKQSCNGNMIVYVFERNY